MPLAAVFLMKRPVLRAFAGSFFVIETIALGLVVEPVESALAAARAVFIDWDRLLRRPRRSRRRPAKPSRCDPRSGSSRSSSTTRSPRSCRGSIRGSTRFRSRASRCSRRSARARRTISTCRTASRRSRSRSPRIACRSTPDPALVRSREPHDHRRPRSGRAREAAACGPRERAEALSLVGVRAPALARDLRSRLRIPRPRTSSCGGSP